MLSSLSSRTATRAMALLLMLIGIGAAVLLSPVLPDDQDARGRAAAVGASTAILGTAVWALSAARERRLRGLSGGQARR
jgi:hypothetical protein